MCPGGRLGIVPGLCTGGVVCALLQWTYNELSIRRIKYVSRIVRHSSPQISPAVPASQPSTPPAPSVLPEPSNRWGDRVLQTLGFRSLSDEELLAKLKATRDEHLRRIKVLEKEVEGKNYRESADPERDS